jgi:hypothetical protein
MVYTIYTGGTIRGTFAERATVPATVPINTIYIATDTQRVYIYAGASVWNEIGYALAGGTPDQEVIVLENEATIGAGIARKLNFSITSDFTITENTSADAYDIKIADDAIGTNHIQDNAITNALMADDAIDTLEIVDDAITDAKVKTTAAIAYSKLNLATSIVNADIAAGAAIVKSKLAALAIVNADVDAAAAIDWTKINKSGQFLFGHETQSGDGTTKVFNIAHGMGATPTTVIVDPALAEARGSYTRSVDGTNITVTYAIAPPNGSSNLSWFWMAIR